MCNLLVQVFRRILRTMISPQLIVRLTVHLTFRLISSTYFREISCCTLSWWVRWLSIRVLGPPVPNMMLLARHPTILLVRPLECPRRKHRPTQDTSALTVKSDQETHTAHLSLGGCFIGVDVYFFLFQRLQFIYLFYSRDYTLFFFIYGLNFDFSYLCFDINFLQNF
jgi:hypothetical protein